MAAGPEDTAALRLASTSTLTLALRLQIAQPPFDHPAAKFRVSRNPARYTCAAMWKTLLHHLGTRLARPIYGGRGSIIALHRVVPPEQRSRLGANRALEITSDDLRAILTLLRARGCAFVSMDEVPALLGQRGPKFAAFTLDDGYRDNVEHALPTFREFGAPFAVNFTRAFSEHTASVWWFTLEAVLHARESFTIEHAGRRESIDARTSGERETAFATLAGWLRSLPLSGQRELLAALCEPAGIDPLQSTRDLILGVDEVRALATEPLASLGAHSLHHLTSNLLDDATLHEEFAGSKRWLEAVLGREVRHLAYPFGGANAVGAREFACARACGFATAVTTRCANLFPAHAQALHALPRLEISGNYDARRFTARAESGWLPALRQHGKRFVTS